MIDEGKTRPRYRKKAGNGRFTNKINGNALVKTVAAQARF